MGLSLRGLLPYAIPGALAIVGCWWYLNRKKNEPDKKQKVHTNIFKELVPTDRSYSGDLPRTCTSSVELSDDTDEVFQTIVVQASNDTCNFTQTRKSTEVEAFDNNPFAELHVVPATEPNVQQCMDAYYDAKVFEQLAENGAVNTHSSLQNFHEGGNQIEEFTFSPTETSTEVDAENILSAELNVKPFTEPSLQPCMIEIDTVVKMSLLVTQSRRENFGNSEVRIEDSSVGVCTQLIQSRRENFGNSEVRIEDSSVGVCTQLIQSRRENFGNSEVRIEDSSVGVCTSQDGDFKSEGFWTANGDAYHSGGSDGISMDSVDSALGNKINEDKKDPFVAWEFKVPKHLVGRLIGKRGRFVKFLKASSGANISISTLPYIEDYQICHIEGSVQQVETSLYLIGSKFKELDLTNIYAPPLSVSSRSVLMTTWLVIPDGVAVEVIVVSVINAGHMFVQQHTHPTFHALRSLDKQMSICYSQSGIPSLPTPVKVGTICVAPFGGDTWRRAKVVDHHSGYQEVEIRYVDYGGYEKVKIDTLKQIRSDFIPLPFQGAEVLLDNVVPLTDEEYFSKEADDAIKAMTKGRALLAQVTNYDGATGLPLVHIWHTMGDNLISINWTLVEKGFARFIDSY